MRPRIGRFPGAHWTSADYLHHTATIRTASIADDGGKLLIDHVAASEDLEVELLSLLPKSSAEGLRLSDHTGLVVGVGTH